MGYTDILSTCRRLHVGGSVGAGMTGSDTADGTSWTKNSRTNWMNSDTSWSVLIAPRLIRIIPVGFDRIMSLSFPHRCPAEKLALISHGAKSSDDATPPGLQRPPVRSWKFLIAASFSTSALLTQPPY
ncbi:unnamed protein product [Periconia digitata]|uniref:Uncharacterized protein n=1 Tax=Periconia digitata TaxID=1303443 RepID=A0A9W4UUH5_9PLEO|nr:unnamed protein product [Periconia digitata]